jgi:DNA replication protein DnaC
MRSLDIASLVPFRKSEEGQTIRICKNHGEYTAILPYLAAGQCPKCGEESIAFVAKQDADRHAREVEQAYQAHSAAASQVPSHLLTLMLESLSAEVPDHKGVLQRMRKYVSRFDYVRKETCHVLLRGTPGTGKTELACALTNSLRARGVHAVYTTQAELGKRQRDTFRDGSSESESTLLDRYAGYDWLLIDELGGGKGSESERGFVSELIHKRHENRRLTVCVTNLLPDQLADEKTGFGKRIQDRLQQWVTIQCAWPSYRKPSSGW